MRRIRHWKQHWDSSAPLVFTKRLRMGDDPDKPFVMPGDPVTPEMRSKLGLHRLRHWWNAGVVERADVELRPTRHQPKQEKGLPRVEARSRGHYILHFADGSQERLRGKAVLEARLEELRSAAV